jgi:hypothetical protein
MTLTDNEKKFLGLMSEVSNESIWGLAISNVVSDPKPDNVRRLITSLKEQAHDCKEVMLSIIGEPGLKQLQAL